MKSANTRCPAKLRQEGGLASTSGELAVELAWLSAALEERVGFKGSSGD
jgi:hypothetical protein